MVDTARAFLSSLTPEQTAQAKFSFTDEERFNWHFIPRVRKGLALREMTPPQKHLAHALLAAGLGQRGAVKAATIMSLEDVLRQIEKDDGERRNPEKYYFSVFGDPAENATWGYRVEGHHISLNWTVSSNKVAAGPIFFGANPAKVPDGPRKGLRALGEEEDLGRAVIASLTPEQKKVAIVDAKAYPDIFTMNSRTAALKGQASGLSVSKMTAKQKDLLTDLLSEYTTTLPEQLSQARQEQIKQAGNNMFFAWAGGEEVGAPHYYRVQAPAFLIEYDDTQNGANHIHSVWRDYKNDFGGDLLKEHYQASHNQK